MMLEKPKKSNTTSLPGDEIFMPTLNCLSRNFGQPPK